MLELDVEPLVRVKDINFLELTIDHMTWNAHIQKLSFQHTKPRTPGGEKSIFTAVIHQWRSHLRQFAREMTIDENNVTMPMS